MPAFHLFTRRYPAIVRAMSRRHIMYNEQLDYLEQQEREGNILLIYPPEPLPIGRTEQNEKKMRRIYALGREMGVRRLEEIKAFLAEAKNENK